MAHALQHARAKGENFIGRNQQQRVQERSKVEFVACEALDGIDCVHFPVRSHKQVHRQACTLMWAWRGKKSEAAMGKLYT